MSSFQERLLAHYGLSESDFASFCLAPTLDNVPGLEEFIEVRKAAEKIKEAIEKKTKVIVYGDYDCDGVMSTSIICHTFHLLGGSIASYLPSRYIDQYGLSLVNAEKIADNGYKLVILVDNGISCQKEVAYLNGRGITTIIIDHHEVGEELPKAYAIIHPTTLGYGEYPVSAGYLSFLFSKVLLGYAERRNLTMGGLSTISDLMPLKGHNRELVRLTLEELHHHPEGNPIASLVSCRYEDIDETTLSMEVAPKINSIGRYVDDSKINRLAHYFGGEEVETMGPNYCAWMNQINEERKNLTKMAIEEADIDKDEPAVFHIGSLKEGLNGILANRFLQSEDKPVMVVSPSHNEEDVYVGSMRSKEGFLCTEFLNLYDSLFLRHGGHRLAAGVAFKKENAAKVKAALNEYATSHPFREESKEYILIEPSEVNEKNFALIKALGPYGFGFKAPEFLLSSYPVSSLTYSRSLEHILTPLPSGGTILGFGYSKTEMSQYTHLDLAGSFVKNERRGGIDFKISQIKPV